MVATGYLRLDLLSTTALVHKRTYLLRITLIEGDLNLFVASVKKKWLILPILQKGQKGERSPTMAWRRPTSSPKFLTAESTDHLVGDSRR